MCEWEDAKTQRPATKTIKEEGYAPYELGEPVLGYEAASGVIVVVRYERDDEELDYWIDESGKEYSITHWMELPAPPETGE